MKQTRMARGTPEARAAEQAKMGAAREWLRKMGASGIGMTCGACGHFDDLAQFTRTAVFGDLPRGHFQCPACGWSVERTQGQPMVHRSGFVEPGAVTLMPLGARL